MKLVSTNDLADELMLCVFSPDFESQFLQEALIEGLQVKKIKNGIALVQGPRKSLSWSRQTWLNCKTQTTTSVTNTAKFLKSQGLFWIETSLASHRRAELVLEQVAKAQHPFKKKTGGFCLLSDTDFVWSDQVTPTFASTGPEISENPLAPSRAYAKLAEAFAYHIEGPKNLRCLEIGACPGGWTCVLSDLGNEILAVDRSPLSEPLMKKKNIQFLAGDGLKITPTSHGHFDWVLSDAIVYPEKLIPWIETWLPTSAKMLCTIKFQGKTDFEVIKYLKGLPNSKLVHLFSNKHELTWIRL